MGDNDKTVPYPPGCYRSHRRMRANFEHLCSSFDASTRCDVVPLLVAEWGKKRAEKTCEELVGKVRRTSGGSGGADGKTVTGERRNGGTTTRDAGVGNGGADSVRGRTVTTRARASWSASGAGAGSASPPLRAEGPGT